MPTAAPLVNTPFGPIKRLPRASRFASGAVRSFLAAGRCELHTPLGLLVPQHTANTLRKRQLPEISLHENGALKLVPLEEQTVVQTPLGPLPAELVAFHDNGALRRVFPLNGALSGYWSQEDEAALAEPMTLDTPMGPVRARLISVHFDREGRLRSLTLWPGETVQAATPAGPVAARIGIAFHPCGAVRSLEPAAPTVVETALGPLRAFDPEAVGLNGDENSLGFDEDGALTCLTTTAHAFEITRTADMVMRLKPPLRASYCDGETPEIVPVHLAFGAGTVRLQTEGRDPVEAMIGQVRAHPFAPPLPRLAPACGLPMAPA